MDLSLSKHKYLVVAISLMVVSIFAGIVSKSIFTSSATQNDMLQMAVDGPCTLPLHACMARREHRSFTLKMDKTVRAMQSFNVFIDTDGFSDGEINMVTLVFDMPAMQMGLNRFRLTKATTGRWQGRGMLPVCSSGRTDWNLKVIIETARQNYRAEFPLTID